MLDGSSTTSPFHISARARRRADAQLYAPRPIRRGARVSSRQRARRSPSRSLRAAVIALVLVGGEMLIAPEFARESARGSASGAPPGHASEHVTASAGETAPSAGDRAVAALLASLSEARQLAERTRQTVTIVLDPATGRLWRLAGDDPDAELASDGAIPLAGTVTLGGSTARPSFTFSHDEVQSDSVWVRDGVARVAVVLDPRSGEPRANR